jgi:Phosphotransferase enzyme family
VMVGGRHGIVIDRIDGPILSEVVARSPDVEALALELVELHRLVNARVVAGLPDLVASLDSSIRTGGLDRGLTAELLALLGELDDGSRFLCHFDLHARNVIVAPDGWVVIDWLLASSGPPDGDFARTLVIDRPPAASALGRFMAIVRREGSRARGIDPERLDGWVRVVAGARVAEGFEGAEADDLIALARGDRRLGC